MRSKMGRPPGSPVRTDLDAATARFWLTLDPQTGRLTWRLSPGGNRVAGDPVTGRRVTLHRRHYSTARVAVLIRTGAFPTAGRVPRNVVAALAGRPVAYAVETPQQRMLALVRAIVAAEPTAWQAP